MASLQNKVLWLTGASSGIGEACALEFARRGARVVLTARRENELQRIAALVTQAGGTAECHPGDVTDRDRMHAIARAIEASLGPVDILVTSAGTYAPTDPSIRFDAEEHSANMRLNYGGTMNPIEAVLPGMIARKSGQLGIISSVVGYRGLPRATAYGPSKAALINFAESARFHLEPRGVRVSIINPGFVKTPLTDKNDFAMPMRISAEEAARHIANGLERERREIHFPAGFSWALKFLRIIPYPLYHFLIRKQTQR